MRLMEVKSCCVGYFELSTNSGRNRTAPCRQAADVTPWVDGKTIDQVLRETVKRYGDRVAVVFRN